MMQDWQFMDIAHTVAMSSTCSRLTVGAILTRDRRIISLGYNGAPSGISHCDHTEDGDTPCEKAVHAEVNTIAFAARAGVSTEGTVLYTTHSPCMNCAKLIINSGIKEVIYLVEYRNSSPLLLLRIAGVKARQLDGSSMQPVSPEQYHTSSVYPGQYAFPWGEDQG